MNEALKPDDVAERSTPAPHEVKQRVAPAPAETARLAGGTVSHGSRSSPSWPQRAPTPGRGSSIKPRPRTGRKARVDRRIRRKPSGLAR